MFNYDSTSDTSHGFEDLETSTGSCDDQHVSIDDSYILFENSVRFASEVRYIEATNFCDDCPESEITTHEMMEMARRFNLLQSDPCNFGGDKEPVSRDSDDDGSGNDSSSSDIDIVDGPEEHTRDIVDLDKQLFVAYMNGINGVSSHMYKSRLETRAQEIRQGRVQFPFFESETIKGTYLDHVLNHVIGIFRNLVAREEFSQLVSLCEKKAMMEQLNSSHHVLESCTKTLLDKIEQLLSERLASEDVYVGKDELSFFAGGVAYAMENWNIYTYD
jgi:hypothetical protein